MNRAFGIQQGLNAVYALDTVGGQIDVLMAPFADELARLDTVPGVNQRTAEVLIAELGLDMTVFPTAQHLASWAGLCPGQNERAGKRRSGKTRRGNRWLRAALIEAALAASNLQPERRVRVDGGISEERAG